MVLPTNRTIGNTALEHVADHNTAHDILNTLNGTYVASTPAGNLSATNVQAALNELDAEKQAASGLADTPAKDVALRTFHTALANRQSAPVRILCLGDSITEGYNVSTVRSRWINRLVDSLRTRYGVTGGAGYLPSDYIVSNLVDPFILAGGAVVIPGSNHGLGRRALSLPGSGAPTATLAFYGTGVDIVWSSDPTLGSFSYAIDGGGATTVSTALAALDGHVTQIRNLDSKPHSLVLTGNIVGGKATVIEGAVVYDGDESRGIHLFDAGHSSYAVSDMLANTNWLATVNTYQPSLVVLEFGANEIQNSVSAATFQTNLTTLITNIKAQCTIPPSFVIVGLYPPANAGGIYVAGWAAFLTAMRTVAAADPTIAYFDLSTRWGDTVTDALSLLYSDKLHLLDKGASFWGDQLADFLVPGGAPVDQAQGPWLIQIVPWACPPNFVVGLWQNQVNANCLGNGQLYNNNTQNDAATWYVLLGRGTWAFDFTVTKNTNGAIATVALDDGAGNFTTIGTVDTYNGSASYNQIQTITGVVVGGEVPIKRQLRITAATRNASNTTGWYLNVVAIAARRYV